MTQSPPYETFVSNHLTAYLGHTRSQRLIRRLYQTAFCWANCHLFCILWLAVASVDAAVIEVEWNSTASQPNETGLFTHNVTTGVATSITGFASLEGIDPSRLTYKYGHSEVYEQIGSPGTSDSAHVVFGGSQAEPSYFDIFLDGNPIATSTDPTFTLDTDFTDPRYPSVGQGEIPVTGVVGTEFYEEILQLTNGTGVMHWVTDLYSGFAPTGHFEGTGRIVVTAVPEPTGWALSLLAVTGISTLHISSHRKRIGRA